MQTINAKYTSTKQKGAQEVSLYIEGLPSGGSATVEDSSITTDKLASKAVTADKIADGVIPTVDTISGATDTGKNLMKAASAAAARSAIGAGTSNFSGSYNDLSDKPSIPSAYKLPAASASALGGVKQVDYVADPAGEMPTKAEFISLRDAMVTAGVMKPAS